MNQNPCKCSECTNELYYEIPTNFLLTVIGLKIYWCHKCDAKNYVWPFQKSYTDGIQQHSKID